MVAANVARTAVADFDGADYEQLARGAAPVPACRQSAVVRCGIVVSSISTRPAASGRAPPWPGAACWRAARPTCTRRPSCFCSCRAPMPLEWGGRQLGGAVSGSFDAALEGT